MEVTGVGGGALTMALDVIWGMKSGSFLQVERGGV